MLLQAPSTISAGCRVAQVSWREWCASSRASHDDLNLNGEILVTSRTDPGWVPLYPSVSGLLVERGSLLSHSAIVAREMGLPAIVGIQGLTQTLRTGMRIRMDGKAGTIRVLGN